MRGYFIYVLVASATIASPGPGVVMTLVNTLKWGLIRSMPGVFGVSLGMLVIAILVGGGLSAVFVAKPEIYLLLKVIGAAYLFYLGIKLIRSRNDDINIDLQQADKSTKQMILHGITITITNPKPIVFFAALFPQFIDLRESYLFQFSILSLTFCLLIIVIHLLYGVVANFIKSRSSGGYFYWVNVLGAIAYMLFSVFLLLSDASTKL